MIMMQKDIEINFENQRHNYIRKEINLKNVSV